MSESRTFLPVHSEHGSKSLIGRLESLWRQFLDSISSNICDYLSLEHLGIILKHLAGKCTNEISRSLPPGYVEGQPNLVLCPSGDILNTALSVYMNDENQPLPQSDEILMCTTTTTKDEVDIFWRRAIFESNRKIYCLINADLLNYDVCESAERDLQEYLQDAHYKDLKYRLFVICDSENEYRFSIASSLERFKRPAPSVNIIRLRSYIRDRLSAKHDHLLGVKPAAYVDWERSSVRVIKSQRTGVGKTLFKERRKEELSELNDGEVEFDSVSIPLQERNIDIHYVCQRLLEHTPYPGKNITTLFHIDISHEVEKGVDYLLFNLLILGCLVDTTGFVWRKSELDLYLIETLPDMIHTQTRGRADFQYVHTILNILPDVTCRSPAESLCIYTGEHLQGYQDSDQLFDEKQFKSPIFQRTYQYLLRLDQRRKEGDIQPENPQGTPLSCLQILLRHCGLHDPSWSELHHFVWFLNTQLVDFEKNAFVSAAASEDLPGFSTFVLRFLIQMSRDFSTRSLYMSEESPVQGVEQGNRFEEMETEVEADDEENELQAYRMRRTWESSPHPYLFFNSDGISFSFLGFFIDRTSGNLIDRQSGTVLEKGIMTKNLYDSLVRNHAPMQENFDNLERDGKIIKLCQIMGIPFPHDPDDTYELTTDNVKKILAIYMRFRCDIPVIIMGETGCGKTRLVKFMCALQVPPGVEQTNMILMKVHGGTTQNDIIETVEKAENLAKQNKEKLGENVYTVLFFDEANTTEAIGMIKEIMCDKRLRGKELNLCENLKIIAACNPYRKHSDELIQKLQQAGLGYHVDAENTTDRLGRIPMRHLVYRVQPLPQSLLPLVWDFGQLNTEVEDLYIRQMVRRYIYKKKLPEKQGLVEVVSAILTASQDYMRNQKDECSFVSLRDVDRVLTVMSWFYEQSQKERTLFNQMDDKIYATEVDEFKQDESENEEEDESSEDEENERVDDLTRALILAIGVCYQACLKDRSQYRSAIADYFKAPCSLPGGDKQMEIEIDRCQEVFLDNVYLDRNIARNMALKENLFMMVVCIELRIPLFLVGKPGSSKSLAKTILSDAMQGKSARNPLFKNLKKVRIVSFQCSPLSTPDGIVGTFNQCARFQKDIDLNTNVSIVVLDEVGLAEDSPRMPLKTLHPLLEDGCQGDEEPEEYKKVGFLGISNWALDPAKMNRGILVQREVPDLEELKNSARGICRTNDKLEKIMEPLIEPLALSYLDIFGKASRSKREFYGLRDFYSLVKMVYSFVEKSKKTPTWHEMLHAIERNFGGLDQVNPVKSFKKHLSNLVPFERRPRSSDPDCTPGGLIEACLFDTNQMQSESRYLLLLTENYGALSIIQQQIFSRDTGIRPITIFGSSFRSDQEYTQVCRNINKIKICMETGKTVVLLNLENLYESLYDALNQYYAYCGGVPFVDLGLGTHRVKCPVHKSFRLIVVAEKETVYKQFPTPLINRLEKHFLSVNTMISIEQRKIAERLEEWAQRFIAKRSHGHRPTTTQPIRLGDVFIGFHDDTCSAIVLHVWKDSFDISDGNDGDSQVIEQAKSVLLWCATPESLVRLEDGVFPVEEQRSLSQIYNNEQEHDSLLQYLNRKILRKEQTQLFAQITTHSKLLASIHRQEISDASGVFTNDILFIETLSSFDTEQQFSKRIQKHIQNTDNDPRLMIIQCDSGDVNANLIACARYCVMDEFEKMREELRAPVHVVFIIQLPRGAAFTGFQCGLWHSAHIDDLYEEYKNMLPVQELQRKSVAKLFTEALEDVSVEAAVETTTSMKTDIELYKDSEKLTKMEWNDNENGFLGASNTHSDTLIDVIRPERVINESPLQLDDVTLELHTFDTDKRVESSGIAKHRLDINKLVSSCVQTALSMVKNKQENTNKETERVALVLTILNQEQNEGNTLFLLGINRLVANLLNEKESRRNVTNLATHWLVNEAAASENINKVGTFRRSCIQTLENKVSPILAGIIAYLDTNDNIKILQERSSWKKELWLTYLNTPGAIRLQLTDLRTPVKQNDLQEVVVTTTGYEGHVFSARMPFSWLLIDKFHELLKLSHTSTQLQNFGDHDGTMPIESAYKVLQEHATGHVLDAITDGHVVKEVVQEYIHDFVHTVYHATSAHEHQLVCQSVDPFVTEDMEPRNSSLLHLLLTVHATFQKLAQRLACFRAMNSVWPECSAVIIEFREKNPNNLMFRERGLAFSTLCLLLENITPKSSELDDQNGRSEWLNKVHCYRPVVEKVINMEMDPTIDRAHCFQSLKRSKGLWSRVLVVKLFLEHVCTAKKEDEITIKYCFPLWNMLDDETDLKDMKSFVKVEKFLKGCNKQAVREYIGKDDKCSQCESVLEGPPITLPCSHVLCCQCFDAVIAFGDNTCQTCKMEFKEDLEPYRHTIKENAADKLKDYQKRCNTFFMDVVSQLCFADNTAPSQEVVKKLLGYIFFTTRGKQLLRTRNLTIFDTGIDPNPVFRSFLLQLLIRTTSEASVKENLEHYFSQAREFMKPDLTTRGQQNVELSLLIIQCLEDMFMQNAKRPGVDSAVYASKALTNAQETICSADLTVEKIYGLAKARMGLSVVSKFIADIVTNGTQSRHIDHKVRKLIQAAQMVYEKTEVEWTRTYLVKYLCRNYGIEVYHNICRNPVYFYCLRWVIICDVHTDGKVVEVSDRYIVCGNHYATIRESLTKFLNEENEQQLNDTIQELNTEGRRVEYLLQLAIHREVTISYMFPKQQRKIKPQVLESLLAFIKTCDVVKKKELMQSLILNELVPGYLATQEGGDLRMQGIQCLMVHFLSAMSHIKGKGTLLQPLQYMISKPIKCVNMFLPTMPQDELADIKDGLMAARQKTPDENPEFYSCPNGHIYIIGDCGRPYVVEKCRECGAEIGGRNHKAQPGNIRYQVQDNTLTGHILGQPYARGRQPKPERTLSTVDTVVIRLLLHLSMYVGSGIHSMDIQEVIKPEIEQDMIEEFVRAHIQQDVDDLHEALGRSVDDVLLLMHSVINSIVTLHNEGNVVTKEIYRLSTKQGREQWELEFSSKFLHSVTKNVEETLKENNQLIVQDQRLGVDPLLYMLYEIDTDEGNDNTIVLQENPKIWRYRTPISLQHLCQELDTKIQKDHKHKVLRLFLTEDHYLQALRYIPSILRLHKLLLLKYQRKLDKTEAGHLTIGHLRKDAIAGEETDQLLQDFADAWELVRDSLKQHLCPTEMGGMIVSKEYCNRRIDDMTPISMLLPTTKEAGLCSYALLDFLMRKQNDFLDKYLKQINRNVMNISSVPPMEVTPMEVTSAHLICYDPQQDVLPLLLANCQYSFEMGKGTTIDYDFDGLERQLMDRFLFSKSKINVGSVLKIDLMVYRTEFTNADVFKVLAEKIPQLTLSPALKKQICDEIRSLPDLCTSLDNLDIAISFLKSTGGPPDKNLHEFMTTTLQMQNSICSQKAQQSCEFRHAKSLWLLLSLQKSKKMVDSNLHSEATFESVLHEFHEVLPDDVVTTFEAYMKNLSIDKLSHIVDILHEYILLVVAVRQNTADEDYTDTTKHKLGEWLYGYVDSFDNPPLDAAILGDFPAEILYKHSVHTWIAAYDMLREKLTGNHRRY